MFCKSHNILFEQILAGTRTFNLNSWAPQLAYPAGQRCVHEVHEAHEAHEAHIAHIAVYYSTFNTPSTFSNVNVGLPQ